MYILYGYESESECELYKRRLLFALIFKIKFLFRMENSLIKLNLFSRLDYSFRGQREPSDTFLNEKSPIRCCGKEAEEAFSSF